MRCTDAVCASRMLSVLLVAILMPRTQVMDVFPTPPRHDGGGQSCAGPFLFLACGTPASVSSVSAIGGLVPWFRRNSRAVLRSDASRAPPISCPGPMISGAARNPLSCGAPDRGTQDLVGAVHCKRQSVQGDPFRPPRADAAQLQLRLRGGRTRAPETATDESKTSTGKKKARPGSSAEGREKKVTKKLKKGRPASPKVGADDKSMRSEDTQKARRRRKVTAEDTSEGNLTRETGTDEQPREGAGTSEIGRVSMPSQPRRVGVEASGSPVKTLAPPGRTGRKLSRHEQSILDRYRQMQAEESLTRTVYVGKLPYNVSEAELWCFITAASGDSHDLHGGGGGIEPPEGTVRIPRNATGWGKGFGFVTLSSAGQLTKALALSGTRWHGRDVVVKMSEKPRACDTVFVSNLAAASPEEASSLLARHVSVPVLSVRAAAPSVPRHALTGHGAGGAATPREAQEGGGKGWFVQLCCSSDMEQALRALAGAEIEGQRLVVDYARSLKNVSADAPTPSAAAAVPSTCPATTATSSASDGSEKSAGEEADSGVRGEEVWAGGGEDGDGGQPSGTDAEGEFAGSGGTNSQNVPSIGAVCSRHTGALTIENV